MLQTEGTVHAKAQNGPFCNKMLGSWGEEADNRETGAGEPTAGLLRP